MSGLGGLDAITMDCADALRLARFWAAVFGRDVGASDGAGPHYVDLLPPSRGARPCGSSGSPSRRRRRTGVHLDVSVEDLDEACARVEALGGGRISEQPLTEYDYEWLVMADLEGNEFGLVIHHEAVVGHRPEPNGACVDAVCANVLSSGCERTFATQAGCG